MSTVKRTTRGKLSTTTTKVSKVSSVKKKRSNRAVNDDDRKAKEKQQELLASPGSFERREPLIKSGPAVKSNNCEDEQPSSDVKRMDESSRQELSDARPEHIKKWIDTTITGGISALRKEFRCAEVTITSSECSGFNRNMSKNRYPNIPCVDRTRFTIADDDNYYIHANKIRILSIKNRFICTQAPVDSSINDFWRMVIASDTDRIVMLCNFMENGTSKCARYYPDAGGCLDFQSVRVTNEKMTDISCELSSGPDKVVQSSLKIVAKNTNKEMRISHYQWVNWPDHGMPERWESTLKMLKIVRKGSKPIMVHCSAGVGRTGTFVLIESMIMALRYPKKQNVKDSFTLLRRDRARMVQTFPQFLYAVRCVLEYFFMKGFERNEAEFEKFKEQYNKFLAKKKGKNSKVAKKKSSQSMDDDNDEKPDDNGIAAVQSTTGLGAGTSDNGAICNGGMPNEMNNDAGTNENKSNRFGNDDFQEVGSRIQKE